MPLSSEVKTEILAKFGQHEKDTGSSIAQIALLTRRIKDLTQHVIINKKDHSTRRGLIKLVGQRRRLQADYKRRVTAEQYEQMLKSLEIRK
jgi:small subunit ribosomal protein S15